MRSAEPRRPWTPETSEAHIGPYDDVRVKAAWYRAYSGPGLLADPEDLAPWVFDRLSGGWPIESGKWRAYDSVEEAWADYKRAVVLAAWCYVI